MMIGIKNKKYLRSLRSNKKGNLDKTKEPIIKTDNITNPVKLMFKLAKLKKKMTMNLKRVLNLCIRES